MNPTVIFLLGASWQNSREDKMVGNASAVDARAEFLMNVRRLREGRLMIDQVLALRRSSACMAESCTGAGSAGLRWISVRAETAAVSDRSPMLPISPAFGAPWSEPSAARKAASTAGSAICSNAYRAMSVVFGSFNSGARTGTHWVEPISASILQMKL